MKLKASVFLATPDELAAVQKARLNQADKTKLTRDHNGFRKLLVVITKAGKLYALHTGDGHVVWSLLVPSLRATYGGPHFAPLKILQWQVPHQHALDQNPVVLIITQAGELLVSNLSFLVYKCFFCFKFHSLRLFQPASIVSSVAARSNLFSRGRLCLIR